MNLHRCCEFDSCLGRGEQYYVIKFVNHLRQVGGFLRAKVVSWNPVHGEVYSIQHCAIKFVSYCRKVGGFRHFQQYFSFLGARVAQ
jgi:hypothetical protein